MGGQVPRKKNITYKLEDMWICMCGLKAKDNVHKTYFSWQNLGEAGEKDDVVMCCWDCADKLHKDFITKEREEGLGEKF